MDMLKSRKIENSGLAAVLEGAESLLASLQANVFVADTGLNLVYANAEALRAVGRIEGELKSVFGVSAVDLLGGSIHRFHRDPARIEAILHEPGRLPHTAVFSFGAVTLYTRINALRVSGEIVGYIVSWEDQSTLTQANSQVEETTHALESAAAAVAELASAITDTSRHASDASHIAREAVEASQTAAGDVALLGEASGEIDKVVRAITAVAEQTKLLALNATIEAARAGEAGKGFAVVAGEVKELATTTAAAAGDISAKIRAIKERVDEVVAAIQRIEGVIGRIDEAQTSIAAVVEEQSAVTADLAGQIQSAAVQSKHALENMR
jgi:hypothetical protein